MKIYRFFFKVRFMAGLQYRGAAIAGAITQVVWGFLNILFLNVFNASVMAPSDVSTYVWLNQMFLAITAIWASDNTIYGLIENGDVSYETVRPVNLYALWFIRNVAYRLSRCFLRMVPVLILSLCLPHPYRLHLPDSVLTYVWFFISLILTLILVVSITMLMYVFTMTSKSSLGIRTLFMAVFDLLSGTNIPLAFFPSVIQKALSFTFFVGLQTASFMIFLEQIDPIQTIGIQLFWSLLLIGLGYYLMQVKLKQFEIVGG